MPHRAVGLRPERQAAGARQEEKRKGPCRFDGHKTVWRSGALCRTARMAYDPENLGAGARQEEKRKRLSNSKNENKAGLYLTGRLCFA
ncbi:hypothetical protein CW734_14475 [Planococcus sp. MB-3u-03]|nr:hypothetical protein CW734_14475 [Planococcus sp. MB-3u-03]